MMVQSALEAINQRRGRPQQAACKKLTKWKLAVTWKPFGEQLQQRRPGRIYLTRAA
ncbi:hypothetical protein PMO01_18930 [Pseudomonas moraviensis R28-S]|uniref:Uncharacterized protein n=1 Tax=Pseudomonas moraviensis R28-S TaxID=1395516 RepID=V8R4L5_9PSED|nr:hypothetical protein PMO01_18930 [Pseudomonas moraviensis R28-S]